MKKDEILALAGECGFKLDWAISNCKGQFESFYHAAIESYKAELLKESGDPVLYAEFAEDGGWLGDASEYQYLLEEPHALYTSDQLVAAVLKATKPLEERRCEICGYAEHHREHTGCLRTQLTTAREEIDQLRQRVQELEKQRDELLSAIAKESAERDAVNTIAKRQSAILTRTGDELADCRVEIAALKAERDTRIAQLERQRDELLAACETYMSHGICEVTYYAIRDAIASVKENSDGH